MPFVSASHHPLHLRVGATDRRLRRRQQENRVSSVFLSPLRLAVALVQRARPLG